MEFIHNSIRNSNLAVVSKYLTKSKGSTINHVSPDQKYYLKTASVIGDDIMVELLIQHGAQFIQEKETLLTVLHHAAARGHLEVVKILVNYGHSTNVYDNAGDTPLDIARICEQHHVVEYLETISL